jgi:ABC-type glutathione transport system ATPase component
MSTCITCTHHKYFQGSKCTRAMTLYDGTIIQQRNTGRMASQERDEKLMIWRKGNLHRASNDVCGVSGKWWERKA